MNGPQRGRVARVDRRTIPLTALPPLRLLLELSWSKKGSLAMSDLLDDFRDDVDQPTSELVYGSVDEFVREYLRHMYTRPVGPGNARYRWLRTDGVTLRRSPASRACGAPGSTCDSTRRPGRARGGVTTRTTT